MKNPRGSAKTRGFTTTTPESEVSRISKFAPATAVDMFSWEQRSDDYNSCFLNHVALLCHHRDL